VLVLDILIEVFPRAALIWFTMEDDTSHSVKPIGVAVIEFNQWNATVLMFSPENLNAV